ncbi:MAG: hypothetical protein HQ582_27095 [Planctomycetes bacterium]|nr:hypothetical protein [Planctomycetota bacterium]
MHTVCRSTAAAAVIVCLTMPMSQGAERESPAQETRPAKSSAQEPNDHLPVVVLLGDSIRINYQGTVRAELEGEAIVWTPEENCAHSFFTLENVDKWIKGRNASVVHINVGLHDLFLSAKTDQPRHSLETYSENLRAIFAKLKELTDAEIIFALTTPVVEQRQASSETYKRVVRRSPHIVEYNRRAAEIAKECGVRIDDVHAIALKAGVEDVIRDDGVHLSEKGIGLIGKQVAHCVLSVLNELAAPKAPFRVLFSNDTTNITSNTSPFHERGEPFTEDKLRASVDETVGNSDVHMLQPGGGRVPWWKSKVAPADEYYHWLQDKARVRLDSMGQYMLGGGDMVQVFVDHCRKCGITPFISLRLNDYHGTEHADLIRDRLKGGEGAGDTRPGSQGCWLGRFYLEHPEYRIGSDPEAYTSNPDKLVFNRDHGVRFQLRINRVLNWAIPEVRAHKLALIAEICEGYDIDGFELDFMRHARYFRLEDTTEEQRVEAMTRFVADVRAVLDRTAKPGQHRWLCVRVPLRLRKHGDLGIDLVRWVTAGVDMVNLSGHFVTVQQSDLAKVYQLVPTASVYLETTFVSHRYPKPSGPRASRNEVYRKMTPEQFYTAAHLAYSRGAVGLSAFNFAYYRSLGETQTEPPFQILDRMRDPHWVAQQPQHYFTSKYGDSAWPSLMRSKGRELKPDRPMEITLDMAPPTGGWKTDGRLRVQAHEAFGDQRLAISFNGTDLEPNSDVSEPYATPWPDGLAPAESLRAWNVPSRLVKDGSNSIVIRMNRGEPLLLSLVDVAIR